MAYFYCKRADGRETCYEVKDIQKDAAERLYNLSDDFVVDYVHEGDYHGYRTLEEYEADNNDGYAEAVREGISNGLAFPFVLIRHSDGSLAPTAESAVDYVGLCQEYDGSQYQIPPEYIESGEYTAETAAKSGRNALSKIL